MICIDAGILLQKQSNQILKIFPEDYNIIEYI